MADAKKGRLEKAHSELSDMCKRHFAYKHAGEPAMRFTIPANENRDSDLILSRALRYARSLEDAARAVVKAQREANMDHEVPEAIDRLEEVLG